MSKRVVVMVVVALVLALGIGYFAGVVHTVRIMCEAEQRARAGVAQSREAGVPYSGIPCETCREYFPDWWCWLGGCP